MTAKGRTNRLMQDQGSGSMIAVHTQMPPYMPCSAYVKSQLLW